MVVIDLGVRPLQGVDNMFVHLPPNYFLDERNELP